MLCTGVIKILSRILKSNLVYMFIITGNCSILHEVDMNYIHTDVVSIRLLTTRNANWFVQTRGIKNLEGSESFVDILVYFIAILQLLSTVCYIITMIGETICYSSFTGAVIIALKY